MTSTFPERGTESYGGERVGSIVKGDTVAVRRMDGRAWQQMGGPGKRLNRHSRVGGVTWTRMAVTEGAVPDAGCVQKVSLGLGEGRERGEERRVRTAAVGSVEAGRGRHH